MSNRWSWWLPCTCLKVRKFECFVSECKSEKKIPIFSSTARHNVTFIVLIEGLIKTAKKCLGSAGRQQVSLWLTSASCFCKFCCSAVYCPQSTEIWSFCGTQASQNNHQVDITILKGRCYLQEHYIVEGGTVCFLSIAAFDSQSVPWGTI